MAQWKSIRGPEAESITGVWTQQLNLFFNCWRIFLTLKVGVGGRHLWINIVRYRLFNYYDIYTMALVGVRAMPPEAERFFSESDVDTKIGDGA